VNNLSPFHVGVVAALGDSLTVSIILNRMFTIQVFILLKVLHKGHCVHFALCIF